MHAAEPGLTLREAALRLRRDHGDRAPNYLKLWRTLCEGHVATERVGRSLRMRESDLPVRAAALGLRSSAKAGER